MGQAITMLESTRPDHGSAAEVLLERLLPHAGGAHRIGITGVPGVGKSTLIDTLGTMLTAQGRRVAVLAVDPSSPRTGGSILGDKTRMARLAADDNAFIRPSPSSGGLGGVTSTTRQAMVVLEAAGYDVVLVETVGIGQSEALVHAMVDFFLVLMPVGAGDDLQVIKRGVLELADMLAVNKADGANEQSARLAAAEIRRAAQILEPAKPGWSLPVLTVSGQTGAGLDELWAKLTEHRRIFSDSGELAGRRAQQELVWMHDLLKQRLVERFEAHDELSELRAALDSAVLKGEITATRAVDRLLAALS